MATKKNHSGTEGGEFPRGREVHTALIRGNTFASKAVQYTEIDGLAVFEGDIVLGTVAEVTQMSDMLRAEMGVGIASGVAITGAQFRWPNCRIPFTIDAALPNQQRVTDAIAHWEANTNFRFVARTTEADFVTFRPGSRAPWRPAIRQSRCGLLYRQHDSRDRACSRAMARAKSRGSRLVCDHQLGQDHAGHGAQLQSAHHRRRRHRRI